jgi:hypothetical protein
MLRAHKDRCLEPSSWTVGEYSDAELDLGVPEHITTVPEDGASEGIRKAFHQDLFTEMFQFSSNQREHLTEDGEVVQDLLDICESLPGFESLKMRCSTDPFLSYIGASAVSDEPLNALDRIVYNNKQEHSQDPGDVPDPPLSDEANKSDMRRAVKKSVQEANDEVEFVQDVMAKGWGTDEPSWDRVSMADRLSFFKRIRQGMLRDVLEEAGRWERLLRAKKKSREAAIAVTDIELGGDLSRLLPSELAALKHPLRRPIFLRNFLERRCLQYSLFDTNPKGRGPVVVINDQSSSMSGSPDIQAKGLILGIDAILKKQDRAITAIPFSSTVAVKERWYTGGRVDTFIEGFESGGTDIFRALKVALSLVSDEQRKADILLITDAEYGFSLEQMKELRATFSEEGAPGLTSIVVGSWRAEQLAEFGEVVRVSNLTKATSRDAIAAEMNRMIDPLGSSSATPG